LDDTFNAAILQVLGINSQAEARIDIDAPAVSVSSDPEDLGSECAEHFAFRDMRGAPLCKETKPPLSPPLLREGSHSPQAFSRRH
jgi:hypothetical protein